jgi:hypothetical protein
MTATSDAPIGALRHIDVVLLVVAAPILILIGVSAVGYGVAAGVWLALRVVELGVNRYAAALGDQKRELLARQLAYPLVRIFLLALTVILLRQDAGKDAGLTALVLIVIVFTINMAMSFATRPRAQR